MCCHERKYGGSVGVLSQEGIGGGVVASRNKWGRGCCHMKA